MSEETTWDKVRGGDTISGGGKEWIVLVADHMKKTFTISHPSKTWTGVKEGPVTVVRRIAPQDDPRVQETVAKGLIATKFGGIEVGKRGKDKTQPYLTPVEFDDPGALLAHLRIFHAAMSDDPTLAGLLKYHATLHRPEHKADDFFEPHLHDPDFAER